MSVKSYQLRLREAIDKLSVSVRTAKEWKQVAENRLSMIYLLDKEIGNHVTEMCKVGTIFGVDPTNPNLPEASLSRLSGEEALAAAMEKLTATASFTSNLVREAAGLQCTLDETLQIAVESSMIQPPIHDLSLKAKGYTEVRTSSPLSAVYEEIENGSPEAEYHDPPQGPAEEIERPEMDTALVVRKRGLFDI